MRFTSLMCYGSLILISSLQAFAEQRLFQELRTLGYVKPAIRASNGAASVPAPPSYNL